MSIELNEGRPVFSDGVPLEAGRTATEEFTVSNTGTADVRYRIYLADVTGDLAASLEFTIRRGDGRPVLRQALRNWRVPTPACPTPF